MAKDEEEVKEEVKTETGEMDKPAKPKKEEYVKLSDVTRLIEEAMASQKTGPIKAKKVTEHTAHAWRLDGKWVVDFVDRNTDPYVKDKIHAYPKFNANTRQTESWIELKFQDGSTKDISLPSYVKNRIPVYCTIIKRNKIDKSYVTGEVEKKKEVNDRLVGTGVMVDQIVERYEEIFELKTPDGEMLVLPAYVIA